MGNANTLSGHAAEIFTKVGIPPEQAPDAREVLRNVRVLPRVVQEFRPLCESLEWTLSESHWRATGVRGFLRNEVPYTVNNSGTLSARAAALLFANCQECPPRERFAVADLGAGTGLFARYLLDEFARLCEQRGKDFHTRLVCYVSDCSPATVDRWRAAGLFEGHSNVVPVVGDAREPARVLASDVPLRAVFVNYLLDSLPGSVVRKGAGGPEEQYVRTHLADGARVAQYTTLGIEQIRAMAGSGDPGDLERLVPLAPVLEFESEFRTVNGRRPYAEEAIAFGHALERIVVNDGAFMLLERTLELLDEAGFVLVNDYGAITMEQVPAQAGTQRFGATAAIGVNFPLLEHHFTARGTTVVTPERDDLLPVHPRLLMRRTAPETRAAFVEIFHGGTHRAIEECEEEARQHAGAGRADKAREAFDRALELRPRDWQLVGEVAEFTIRQVGDYESGLRLAHAALAMNPWYSVWLWNVLGDALFALERFAEAHEAYLEARRIEADDARTCLNLAYTFAQIGELDTALAAIAAGLVADRTGLFRQRLLEKQQHILTLSTQRSENEREWQARRLQRLVQL
ncbi:tetratricopeptide repeat protein [Candidatus Binatia bacterium]|nr:tetratricopeptide repeat protein [Candidatus Binatia bacterium]